jgi:hypothetical protein
MKRGEFFCHRAPIVQAEIAGEPRETKDSPLLPLLDPRFFRVVP